MKGTIATILALLITASVLPTESLAQGEEEQEKSFDRPGLFVGAQGTFALHNFDDTQIIPDATGDVKDTGGFNVRVGKRYRPHFAMELEYEWYDDFGKGDLEIGGWMLGANARIYMAKGRVQPFFLAGGGLLVLETDPRGAPSEDKEDFAFRFGVGAEIYITDQLALTTDVTYVAPAGGQDDRQFGTLSGGILWRM